MLPVTRPGPSNKERHTQDNDFRPVEMVASDINTKNPNGVNRQMHVSFSHVDHAAHVENPKPPDISNVEDSGDNFMECSDPLNGHIDVEMGPLGDTYLDLLDSSGSSS